MNVKPSSTDNQDCSAESTIFKMPRVPDLDTVITKAAMNVSYFTPEQPTAAGAFRASNVPRPQLFTPLKIKDMTIPNRIGVSPMCMYSAKNGVPTDYHLVHYGQYALRGPGMVIMESIAVTPAGRITPNCIGIYTKEQKSQLKRITEFYHSQKKLIGPQLSHAGMRSSCLPLFYDAVDYPIDNKRGGWLDKVYGPSTNSLFPYSKVLTVTQIKQLVQDFKESARASIVDCGFDFVEVHAAHGFLLHQFMSPLSNKRTDEYGGSFENRCRFLVEVLDAINDVRKEIKRDFPVFVRISASDNDESFDGSWKFTDSLKLAPILVEHNVDLIDVSSGGIVPAKPPRLRQTDMAKQIKQVVDGKCFVSAVGHITDGKYAEKLLEEKYCDVCLSARGFLKDPGMVERWADDMGVNIQMNMQAGWCFGKVWSNDGKL